MSSADRIVVRSNMPVMNRFLRAVRAIAPKVPQVAWFDTATKKHLTEAVTKLEATQKNLV